MNILTTYNRQCTTFRTLTLSYKSMLRVGNEAPTSKAKKQTSLSWKLRKSQSNVRKFQHKTHSLGDKAEVLEKRNIWIEEVTLAHHARRLFEYRSTRTLSSTCSPHEKNCKLKDAGELSISHGQFNQGQEMHATIRDRAKTRTPSRGNSWVI